MGKLLGIAIASTHRSKMIEVDNANITIENGIEGDCRGKRINRQVSVITRESWSDACSELNTVLPWTTRRANLLLENISIEESKGKFIKIADVVLEISGETEPCEVMDEQFDGLKKALVPNWRAGVICKVIRGGKIVIGNIVELLSENPKELASC